MTNEPDNKTSPGGALKLHVYRRPNCEEENTYNEAAETAQNLLNLLSTPNSNSKFQAAQKIGTHSAEAQKVVWDVAKEMGFTSEKKGLFATYETAALRPDMFKKLGNTGILLEVERGKTLINNMDLLDFWKTHICKHASYLFLFVPHANTRSGRKESVFPAVIKRLGSFYDQDNLTNVKAAFIFGY